MKKYKIKFCNGIREKRNGFYFSIDFFNSYHAGIICGILKRPYFYIDKKNINIGYVYINLSAIRNLFI